MHCACCVRDDAFIVHAVPASRHGRAAAEEGIIVVDSVHDANVGVEPLDLNTRKKKISGHSLEEDEVGLEHDTLQLQKVATPHLKVEVDVESLEERLKGQTNGGTIAINLASPGRVCRPFG